MAIKSSPPTPAANIRGAHIGPLIKAHREEAGYSQKKLGELLGYRYGNFIGMIETGYSLFPADRALDFARVLGIKPHVLLKTIIEEMHPDWLKYIKFRRQDEIAEITDTPADQKS